MIKGRTPQAIFFGLFGAEKLRPFQFMFGLERLHLHIHVGFRDTLQAQALSQFRNRFLLFLDSLALLLGQETQARVSLLSVLQSRRTLAVPIRADQFFHDSVSFLLQQ